MQLKFQKFSAEGPSPSQNSPTGKGDTLPHLTSPPWRLNPCTSDAPHFQSSTVRGIKLHPCWNCNNLIKLRFSMSIFLQAFA